MLIAGGQCKTAEVQRQDNTLIRIGNLNTPGKRQRPSGAELIRHQVAGTLTGFLARRRQAWKFRTIGISDALTFCDHVNEEPHFGRPRVSLYASEQFRALPAHAIE